MFDQVYCTYTDRTGRGCLQGCTGSQNFNSIKGTVARDIGLLAFSHMNRPNVDPKNRLSFFQFVIIFAEIFENEHESAVSQTALMLTQRYLG
jgi:hypothetical protein